jgi:hypothetical protein
MALSVVVSFIHRRRRYRLLALGCGLCLGTSACLPALPEPDLRADAAAPSAKDAATASASTRALCPPLLSGELLLNEVVVRPGGLDADGDGASTGRDEVIEVVSLAAAPGHALGVVLRIDGVVRGEIVESPCLQPGQAALLVGSTTAAAGRVATLPALRLDHTLRLRDSPSRLELFSAAGGLHDSAPMPAALGNAPAVWTRVPDADPDGEWWPHQTVPPFRPWSLGACAGGGWFPDCIQSQLAGRVAN